MKILLVEDDEAFLAEAIPEIERIVGRDAISVARSRTEATALLSEKFFDAFILDLRIPTTEGSLDESVEHGQLLLHDILEASPGSLVYFLTGSSTDSVITDILDQADKVDLWGEHALVSTVQLVRKADLPMLLTRLERTAKSVAALDEVELSYSGAPLALSAERQRILRVFARRWNGLVCRVRKVSTGLSGALVVIATVDDESSKTQISAVGKLSTVKDVDAESDRFKQVKRLDLGAYPEQVDLVRAGTKGAAGAFYRLVDGPHETLFELLARDPQAAARAATEVLRNLEPWQSGANSARRTVRDVRRCLLSDDSKNALVRQYGLDWVDDFENRPLVVKWGYIHGDLHCGNVLVRNSASPILIDFGDVKKGALAIDPVALELSLLFHPDAHSLRGAPWPTQEQAANWFDRATFAQGCPYADFITACRSCAHAIAADREVVASAYSFLLRQLKYGDTDKDLVRTLLAATRTDLDGSFGGA